VDHPGWSWQDLQAAPADVVETMRMIQSARIEAANRETKRRERA